MKKIIGDFIIRHYESGCSVTYVGDSDCPYIMGVCNKYDLSPAKRQVSALSQCIDLRMKAYGPKEFMHRLKIQLVKDRENRKMQYILNDLKKA